MDVYDVNEAPELADDAFTLAMGSFRERKCSGADSYFTAALISWTKTRESVPPCFWRADEALYQTWPDFQALAKAEAAG